ncbi:MAG: replication initiation protein [Cetobacterium sp.]|nr:replication initiation protein [Cetobacterium sp.]
MKAVVKYHNDLNTFSFNEFTEKEWDLFFAICYKIKDKGTDVVEFDFSELKELLDLKKKPERLREYILSLNEKLLSMKFTYHIELDVYDTFVFFSRLQTNFKTGKLEITINFPVKYLLNDLMKNYTKFDLMDFVSLKSTYSKKLFKLLKQWETVKEKKFLIEEFRYELGVPKSYKMSDIDKRVFKIIMEELPKHFIDLKLEKIKTGKTITSLKFTWSRKVKKIEPKKNDDVIDIIEISEKLNQAIEKAKKNRFIEKLLTIDNIEILTQMFQENDLIKGLNWAYKEIRQDINTLNYLIKAIRTGAEKKEKKIVVKKSEEKQTNLFDKTFEEIPFNFDEEPKEKEVQKITKEEYEKLYKKYLKENNIKNLKSVRKGFDLSNKSKYIIIEDESQEKLYCVDELPQEKLLSKTGKELKGMPLLMRLRKLAKDMQIKIRYKDEIIKGDS